MRWPWNSSVRSPIDHIGGTPRPRPWWRRNLPALTVALAVILGVGVWRLVSWNPCGPGLVSDGPVCVGLDLNGSGFGANDKLRPLEKMISDNNKAVAGSNFVTIVYLDDMVPDPEDDIVTDTLQEHRVEGAITAQEAVNNTDIAGPKTTKVKLLLANYGVEAADESEAVSAIKASQKSQNIVAVTGVGESLQNTQEAIAGLSAAPQRITTVSALASGDDMNQPLKKGGPAPYFYRVTSTDENEADAAVSYMQSAELPYDKILIVNDQNSGDEYAGNLGSDFVREIEKEHLNARISWAPYSSHKTSNGITRPDDVNGQFAIAAPGICSYRKPDLIYFAGRGTDLKPFLDALGEIAGGCNLGNITVLSGDDVNDAAGSKFHVPGSNVKIYYTAVATSGEWKKKFTPKGDETDPEAYSEFQNSFENNYKPSDPQNFKLSDLQDGHAIMEYDALLTATKAVRANHETSQNPENLEEAFNYFNCDNPALVVDGASGQIAFPTSNPGVYSSPDQGNPIDRPVPIMELNSDGSVTQKDMKWSDGKPFKCGKASP